MGLEVSDPERFIDFRKAPGFKPDYYRDVENGKIYTQLGLIQADGPVAKVTFVYEVVFGGEPEIVEMLFDKGIEVNLVAINEMEFLAWASK